MSKFVLIYHGAWEYTQETMDGWTAWFATIADHVIDSGNPFGPGREVTKSGVSELTAETPPAAGYTIVSADDMDGALKLLDGCPIIHSVRVYEAMAM